MPKRLIITIVCFHISAVLSLLFGLGTIVFGLVARSVFGHTGTISGDDIVLQVESDDWGDACYHGHYVISCCSWN